MCLFDVGGLGGEATEGVDYVLREVVGQVNMVGVRYAVVVEVMISLWMFAAAITITESSKRHGLVRVADALQLVVTTIKDNRLEVVERPDVPYRWLDNRRHAVGIVSLDDTMGDVIWCCDPRPWISLLCLLHVDTHEWCAAHEAWEP